MSEKDTRERQNAANEALAKAKQMEPGEEKDGALKDAKQQADSARMHRLVDSEELRPPK